MNHQTFPDNSSLPLADNILSVPKSATLAINELSKQLIQEGQNVIRLGLGQSPFPVPDMMVCALKAYAATKDYMQVQGYLPLREAIAQFIKKTEGLERPSNNVIIGPGSKELLFGLQMALDCDLVLPAPSWVSYDPQARLLGRSVHWLPCYADDGWKLTAETLDRHCKDHPDRRQLLIINSPNNPSGACFSEDELKALADVASRHQVIVLSDEIYSELHYSGNHQSLARYYPEGTIISNGISKWAGAGGWRLGFFSFPDELIPVLQSMIVIASETFTSVSAPVQMAAISAFEGSDELFNYIHAARKIMREISVNIWQQFQQANVEVIEPQGGFYNLPDFSHYQKQLAKSGITSSNQLCREILKNTGVAGLPGSDFGINDGLLIRFAFVDFDGSKLIEKLLEDPALPIDQQTPELEHLFQAVPRINNWLNSL